MMVNDTIELQLSLGNLRHIGAKISPDVNFFLSGRPSANVRGIGEKIERIEEDRLKLQLFTPTIACPTKQIYNHFREKHFDPDNIDLDFIRDIELLDTKQILTMFDASQLNDLFQPALELYPNLRQYINDGRFFTGTGSSFFTMGG